jgi:hypothetical protein
MPEFCIHELLCYAMRSVNSCVYAWRLLWVSRFGLICIDVYGVLVTLYKARTM